MYYYKSRRPPDTPVEEALRELAKAHPSWGFWKMHSALRRAGKPWNHKRVWRVYRKLGLQLRRKVRKRIPRRDPQPLEVPNAPQSCWSLDFMSDSLEDGRRFRVLNIIDDCTREALQIAVDTSMGGERVCRELQALIATRGKPTAIRTDNGPEFTSKALQTFCAEQGIRQQFIQPGKPAQNAFIERFNRTFREDILDAHLFTDLRQVRELVKEWLPVYNHHRPHAALGGKTPAEVFQEKSAKRKAKVRTAV